MRLKGDTRYYRTPGASLDAGGFGERLVRDLYGIDNHLAISASMVVTQQYLIYIRGDALDEVTEQALHLTYFFLMRALQEHRRQGRNGEFEAFAVQILALLQQNRHLYTVDTSAEPDTDLAA